MNLSSPFISRPVATTLLTVAVALAEAVAYHLLPVAPLPEVDFPTVSVSAALPGASPETMASSVATPLERQFGRIAGVAEMTSSSSLGSTSIALQFDLEETSTRLPAMCKPPLMRPAPICPPTCPATPHERSAARSIGSLKQPWRSSAIS